MKMWKDLTFVILQRRHQWWGVPVRERRIEEPCLLQVIPVPFCLKLSFDRRAKPLVVGI